MNEKAKKILGIILAVVMIVIVGGLVVLVALGGWRLKSITGDGCASAPLVINGSQVQSVEALESITGHDVTSAEASNLGIVACDGGLCMKECPAVTS